jgi:hypothetical protein
MERLEMDEYEGEQERMGAKHEDCEDTTAMLMGRHSVYSCFLARSL